MTEEKYVVVPVKTKRKNLFFRHIRVFDRRIKVTVILTSVKNMKNLPAK